MWAKCCRKDAAIWSLACRVWPEPTLHHLAWLFGRVHQCDRSYYFLRGTRTAKTTTTATQLRRAAISSLLIIYASSSVNAPICQRRNKENGSSCASFVKHLAVFKFSWFSKCFNTNQLKWTRNAKGTKLINWVRFKHIILLGKLISPFKKMAKKRKDKGW